MSVLIDPYMFELYDEKEIKDNVAFFQEIIRLYTHLNQRHSFRIVIYAGMVDKIRMLPLQPFPILLETIQDNDLKQIIMKINNLFSNVLLQSIESIDIDECDGNQEFEITDDDEMIEDNHYYDMFCTLLIPCYLKQIDIDDRILTGKKAKGKQIGDKFQIKCSCSGHEYIKNCCFVGIDEIFSDKYKVIKALKEKVNNQEIDVAEVVLAEMGEHHNHVQSNGKKFDTLNDLSFKNKRVLKLLQELGLHKIIFGRFTPQGVRTTGTMRILSVDQKDTQDIVKVKFNAETGFQLETDLYFPRGVGELLHKYFQAEQLEYYNVNELLEEIK